MERLFYMPTREATPAPTWLEPRAETMTFSSADGTELRGWFIPARCVDPHSAGTVLHLHGNAGSMVSHLGFVEHLPAAGFNVMLMDYRGYGESAGSAWSRGPLVEDALAGFAALRARADVDPSRIALYGVSLGGAIAIAVAERDLAQGGEIQAIVLESPFACWRDVAANALGGDPPALWARALASLLVKGERAGAPRPLDAIARIDRPILILHGDADSIVPVSHGRRLAASAPDAQLVEFAGGEHNSLQETHPEARRRMVEFLEVRLR